MSIEGGFGLTVTVEMSTELIRMLGEEWSEPIQVKVRRLPVDQQHRATHEMIAQRHDCEIVQRAAYERGLYDGGA